MKYPGRYFIFLNGSMLFIGFLYLGFGVICYWFFGEETNDVITLNLPDNALVTIVKVCLCLEILGSFAIQLFPVWDIIEPFFFVLPFFVMKSHNDAENSEQLSAPGEGRRGMSNKILQHVSSREFWARNIFRAIVVMTIIMVAIFIPFFGAATNLVGSFSNSIAGFILPPLLYMQIFRKDLRWWEWGVNIMVVCAGVLVSVYCTASTLVDIYYKILQT